MQWSNSEKWLGAIKSKLKSIEINSVWTLDDSPEGIKPIGCEWIFQKDQSSTDGKVETYKAHFAIIPELELTFWTYVFVMNKEEPCIFKWAKYFAVLFLVLSVDEIFLIGNGILALQGIKVWVSSNFFMFKTRYGMLTNGSEQIPVWSK